MASTTPGVPAVSADEALRRLNDGNERFLAGEARFPTVQKEILADMARGREEPLPAGVSDLTGTHANLDLALLTAALLADEQDRPAAIVARGLVCRLPAHGEQDQG